MLTEKQQSIVDSLVREFTKMNTPINTGKKSLLDWGEIYAEKDEWDKTKAEVDLINKAFLDNAKLEVERISNMLMADEFHDHFYIHQPSNNNIQYGWHWYIVPHGESLANRLFGINMVYRESRKHNESKTHGVDIFKSIHFKHSLRSFSCPAFDSIESMFKDEILINTIKKHINK